MHASPLISLYTALLRSGVKYEKKTCVYEYITNTIPSSDMRDKFNLSLLTKDVLKSLFKNGTKLFSDLPQDNYVCKDVYDFNNPGRFGIKCWSEAQLAVRLLPNWAKSFK